MEFVITVFMKMCLSCKQINVSNLTKQGTAAFVLHYLSHFFNIFPTRGFVASMKEGFGLDGLSCLVSLLSFCHKTNIFQVEKERVNSQTNVLVHTSGVSMKTHVPSKVQEMLDEMTLQQV